MNNKFALDAAAIAWHQGVDPYTVCRKALQRACNAYLTHFNPSTPITDLKVGDKITYLTNPVMEVTSIKSQLVVTCWDHNSSTETVFRDDSVKCLKRVPDITPEQALADMLLNPSKSVYEYLNVETGELEQVYYASAASCLLGIKSNWKSVYFAEFIDIVRKNPNKLKKIS